MFILGFRPGSVIVDYKMKVGQTKENEGIEKEELVEILKVIIEANRAASPFEAATVIIEGKWNSATVRQCDREGETRSFSTNHNENRQLIIVEDRQFTVRRSVGCQFLDASMLGVSVFSVCRSVRP